MENEELKAKLQGMNYREIQKLASELDTPLERTLEKIDTVETRVKTDTSIGNNEPKSFSEQLEGMSYDQLVKLAREW